MFLINLELYFVLFIFFTGLLVFCSIRKHLLLSLLSLEYIVLFVYVLIIFYINLYPGDIYIILLYLTFSVCEGVLGLSILVSIIRCHGNDQISSLFY